MAIYSDLSAAIGSAQFEPLREQIIMAISVKAYTIAISTTPTAAQVAWAKSALADPGGYLKLLLNYIVAQYNTQTVAVIAAATDAQVQTAVNAAVDTLLAL